jgi:ParB family chromosome partitioning protein
LEVSVSRDILLSLIDPDPEQPYEVFDEGALAENVQRTDLSPLEEAQAYQERIDAGLAQEALSQRIGKDRTYIAQKLRLLTLPPPLQHYLDHRVLSEGHARQLLRIRDM